MQLLNPLLFPAPFTSGAHILSGNVMDPKGLEELFPKWKEMEGVPVTVSVASVREAG